METIQTQMRKERFSRDLRGLPPEDLLVSQSILEQLKVRLPENVLADPRAVHTYFAQAYVNLFEICARPEIKSLPAEIQLIEADAASGGGVGLAMSQSRVSPAEEAALDSFLGERFGGGGSEALMRISTQDLNQLSDDIGRYIGEHLPRAEEGEGGGDNPLNQLLDDMINNRLVNMSEEEKRQMEEVEAALKSGAFQSASMAFLALVFINVARLNRYVGQAVFIRDEMTRNYETMTAQFDLTAQQGTSTIADQSAFNAETMKFSSDSSMVSFVIQKAMGDRETFLTFGSSGIEQIGRPQDVMLQNIQKAV